MPAPIITLLTDFGLEDHYVGVMKGVLLRICPDAQLVDLTHSVAPFSIHAGAYALAQAAPYFPAGTTHLVVVDPGVGTQRRAILVEAHNQYFVAPDNGVLTLAAANDPARRIYELTNRTLWLPQNSSTFHGRDIFSPVAAAIASGKAKPAEVGQSLDAMTLLTDTTPVGLADGALRGVVLSVDHFGNVITNIPAAALLNRRQSGFTLQAGSTAISRFSNTFGSAPENELFVYAGSSGNLEIGVNQQRASDRLGLKPGAPLDLHFAQ